MCRSAGGKFSRDGKFLVLGSTNGMVIVADLIEINRRLKRFGVGWDGP